MDKTKAKVSEFLHKSGKHDTTVHESVNPAVVHETVKPHQHEQVTKAVDREVHQDHYHTSVQPVHDQQVLPEKHHHTELPSESREFKHGNDEHISAKLQQEQAKFRDHTVTSPTTSTQETAPVVAGEHKHHHVHEVIQPVVHKETVEPHVVHSVGKVHEKHQNPAQVHETSTLPAMNISDFKGQGGVLTGRDTKTDGFGGEPRHIGGELPHTTGTTSSHSTVPHHNPTTTGIASSHDSVPHHNPTTTMSGSDHTTTQKPSMKDKLNPKVDADGDGKAGLMS